MSSVTGDSQHTATPTGIPVAALDDLAQRRSAVARRMARAIQREVFWDATVGSAPSLDSLHGACLAALDLLLQTLAKGRPAAPAEVHKAAHQGAMQARMGASLESVLSAQRVAGRVAWDLLTRHWGRFGDPDPQAVVTTAQLVFQVLDAVTVEISRAYLAAREVSLMKGTRANSRFFHALLSDTFDNELVLRKQALALDLQLANSYVAAIYRFSLGHTEPDGGAESLMELVRETGTEAESLFYTSDAHTLVVLAASTARCRALAQNLASLAPERWGPKARVRCGVGGLHEGLHGVSRSYLEAQQALDVGRRVDSESDIHDYDRLLPYMILAQQPLLLDRFVRQMIGAVLDSDQRRDTQLTETLRSYLRWGSAKTTATNLHLHRHTVLYRLTKIRDLLNADLDDPLVRSRLQLAFDLLALA